MATYETHYVSKAEIVRKLVQAYRESGLCPEWSQEKMEALAETAIKALNKASETHSQRQ